MKNLWNFLYIYSKYIESNFSEVYKKILKLELEKFNEVVIFDNIIFLKKKEILNFLCINENFSNNLNKDLNIEILRTNFFIFKNFHNSIVNIFFNSKNIKEETKKNFVKELINLYSDLLIENNFLYKTSIIISNDSFNYLKEFSKLMKIFYNIKKNFLNKELKWN